MADEKAVAVRKSSFTLVEDATGRFVSTRGYTFAGWLQHMQRQHVIARDEESQWCSMECHTRHLDGRNTPANREKARNRHRRIFKQCLGRDLFLFIQYAQRGNGKRGEIERVKVRRAGVPLSARELQAAREQLYRMLERKDCDEKWYYLACRVAGLALEES
jgi:hypothetical protein